MDQVTEFCEAIWKGDAPTIARLVSRVDPNGEDRWHRRALSMAAQYGDARLVRQLLDRGADVDAGRSQLTPLAHCASSTEKRRMIPTSSRDMARHADRWRSCAPHLSAPRHSPFLPYVLFMAVGWAQDGAVQDQIDATVDSAVKRARSRLAQGQSLLACEECGEPIPEARRQALPGVRRCVRCQSEADRLDVHQSLYNRRGSKDSQLK